MESEYYVLITTGNYPARLQICHKMLVVAAILQNNQCTMSNLQILCVVVDTVYRVKAQSSAVTAEVYVPAGFFSKSILLGFIERKLSLVTLKV